MDSLPNGNNTTGTTIAATAGANPTAPPSSNLPQLTESLKLEHQFLRVPFEHYKKTIRANHRAVEKEMSAVIPGVTDAASADLSPDDAVNHLNSLVSRLQGLGLKRKLEEGSQAEHLQAQKCRALIDHLESADADNLSEWNNTRLKWILVDYMLRMSYYDTAQKLAECNNLQDLDIDVFQEAKKVIDALQNKDVAPALAWCADNKPRLKKSKEESSFPFPAEFNNIVTLFDFDESWRSPWRFLRKKIAKQIKLENLKQKILRDIPRLAVITCYAFKIYLDAGIVPSDSKAKATLQAFSNNEITVKSIAEKLVKDAEQEYGITLECDYDTMVFPKIPCW